jgi:hypothetical protein
MHAPTTVGYSDKSIVDGADNLQMPVIVTAEKVYPVQGVNFCSQDSLPYHERYRRGGAFISLSQGTMHDKKNPTGNNYDVSGAAQRVMVLRIGDCVGIDNGQEKIKGWVAAADGISSQDGQRIILVSSFEFVNEFVGLKQQVTVGVGATAKTELVDIPVVTTIGPGMSGIHPQLLSIIRSKPYHKELRVFGAKIQLFKDEHYLKKNKPINYTPPVAQPQAEQQSLEPKVTVVSQPAIPQDPFAMMRESATNEILNSADGPKKVIDIYLSKDHKGKDAKDKELDRAIAELIIRHPSTRGMYKDMIKATVQDMI